MLYINKKIKLHSTIFNDVVVFLNFLLINTNVHALNS
jgi:hypothetical protein